MTGTKKTQGFLGKILKIQRHIQCVTYIMAKYLKLEKELNFVNLNANPG